MHKLVVSVSIVFLDEGRNEGHLGQVLYALLHNMPTEMGLVIATMDEARITHTPNAMPLERGSLRNV